MSVELHNIKWFYIDGIPCIGFCDEGTVLPDAQCNLAFFINKEQQYCFGHLKITSDDKLVFNYSKEGE